MDAFIIRCLYVQPGEAPVERYLDATEGQLKEMVDGNIASIGIDDDVCCIYNALGEKLKLPVSCELYNQSYHGPVVLVGFSSEDGTLRSLDDDNMEYYTRILTEN